MYIYAAKMLITHRLCNLNLITNAPIEPSDAYPHEKTTLFYQLVFRALAEEIVSDSKAAELLGLSLLQLRQARKLELLDAAFNQ